VRAWNARRTATNATAATGDLRLRLRLRRPIVRGCYGAARRAAAMRGPAGQPGREEVAAAGTAVGVQCGSPRPADARMDPETGAVVRSGR
jgi:hypothetical protein